MKDLKTIQTIAKIMMIICKVLFVIFIIGTVGCIVGAISIAVLPNDLMINGQTIRELIENNADITYGDIYAATISGACVCAAGIYTSYESRKYYELELKEGTPFTKTGSKAIRELGIKCIVAPVVAFAVAAAICAIVKRYYPTSKEFDFDNGTGLAIGIFYLLLSVIFSYGEHLEEKAKKNNDSEVIG